MAEPVEESRGEEVAASRGIGLRNPTDGHMGELVTPLGHGPFLAELYSHYGACDGEFPEGVGGVLPREGPGLHLVGK